MAAAGVAGAGWRVARVRGSRRPPTGSMDASHTRSDLRHPTIIEPSPFALLRPLSILETAIEAHLDWTRKGQGKGRG